ncbi:MAG TPA: S26 family signal peptidase [Longimicrobiaceae bacterium]|jgi:conjugative transfer signal peptidase TraF|nr:S26 family signal peptidase [Longimicrobiaceae bacterium]
MSRRLSLAVSAVALSVPALVLAFHLELNHTESGPLGIWRAYPDRVPAVGEFVRFCMRPEQARATAGRPYAGGAHGGPCPFHTWMLAKPVVASPGDTVVHTPGYVKINGRTLPLSATRARDSEGLKVPTAAYGRFVLGRGEFWVHSPYADGSFDSRYVGIVRTEQMRGTLRPVLTWLSPRQRGALRSRGLTLGLGRAAALVPCSSPPIPASTAA